MLKRLAYCFATLFVLFSCTREQVEKKGEGTVSLHFFTDGMQATKAETTLTYAEMVADGSAIAYTGTGPYVLDLVILVFDSEGDLVTTFPDGHETGNPETFKRGTVVLEDDELKSFTRTEAEVNFTLPAGNYTVYAFANTAGWDGSKWRLTGQGESQSASDYLQNLTAQSAVDALTFQSLDGTPLRPHRSYLDDDDYTITCMPLSAKGSLEVVSSGNGEVSMPLKRCVAKVTAIIKNQTGGSLTLYDYQHVVHGMFPETGYLVPHNPDYADATPGNLTANPGFAVPIGVNASMPYSWYVFPSSAPGGTYTIDIQFTLDNSLSAEDRPQYTYTSLPITNWRAVSIPSLERNQHITVTTRVSLGLTVSFNFEVSEWDEHDEYVQFE